MSTNDHGPIARPHAEVLDEDVLWHVERLGGRLPEASEVREWVVETVAGPYPVPRSVQALLAVVWPDGEQLRTTDEFDWEVRFGGFEVSGLIVEDRPRAWYGVGHDEGQWMLLVDLDEAAAAGGRPRVYRVDHEGGEPAPFGESLDTYLFGLRRTGPAVDLGRACVRGDVPEVRRRLCEGGVSTGPLDDSGLTLLHLAVVSCSAETVQTLLSAGSDANAATTRMVDITETYLRPDVDDFSIVPFSLTTDETPLHVALKFLGVSGSRQHVPDVLRVLLAAGADPNAATPNAEKLGETEGWNAVDAAYNLTRLHPDSPEPAVCLRMLREAGGELALLAKWAARDGYEG